MSDIVIGVVLACVASCLFNGGIALQAMEARTTPAELGLKLSLIGQLIRRRRWLAGIGLHAVAVPTQTVALLLAPLTVVQPADASGLLLLLFLGSRMLGERVGPREWGAVVALIAGIVVLTLSAPKREVTTIDGIGVLIPLLVVAAFALAPLVLRRADSIIVVLGAGAAFAVTAFAIKLAADAIDQGDVVQLVVAGVIAAAGAVAGTLSEQTALQRRPATQVAPVIFVVELLVPVALAVLVVGESWSGSALPIALAIAVIVGAVVVIQRSPQVVGLIGAEAAGPAPPGSGPAGARTTPEAPDAARP
jgi:drug/metabolite transporter (DMT)-like permease